jgi:hypothetical protein
MELNLYLMEWVIRERLALARATAAEAARAGERRRECTPLDRALGSLVAWTVRWPAPLCGRRATERARPAGAPPLP